MLFPEEYTAEELEAVKQRTRANFIRGLQGNGGMASQLAWYQTFTGDWRNLFKEVEQIEAVTLEACRAFFDTYYAANNLVLVIVGDFDTAETLAQVRRSFGKLEAADSIPRNPTRVVPARRRSRPDCGPASGGATPHPESVGGCPA